MPIRTTVTAIVLAALLGSCAHGHRATSEEPQLPVTATLTVTNYNWLDIEVYAVGGSTSYRLGEVPTSQTASFELAPHMLGRGTLRIRVHPVGARADYSSPTVGLSPGNNLIDLRVDNVISHSTVTSGVERD